MRTTMIVAGLLVLVSPLAVRAQDLAPARALRPVPTLTVTGEGQVSATPDMAVVRLGVYTQQPEAAAAQARVNEAMQKVIAAVKQAEVPAERIQTSALSLHPVTTQRPPRRDDEAPPEPRVVGYRAQITITARLSDLKRVGPVIDAALGAGANTLQGISFTLEDDRAAKAAALKSAVESARSKADALAGALGVRIPHLIEVVEGGAHVIEPTYETYALEPMRAAMPSTPVEAGQVQVSASVTLRYRMSGPGVEAPEPDGAGASGR